MENKLLFCLRRGKKKKQKHLLFLDLPPQQGKKEDPRHPSMKIFHSLTLQFGPLPLTPTKTQVKKPQHKQK